MGCCQCLIHQTMPVVDNFTIEFQIQDADKLKSLSYTGSMHPRIRGLLPEILAYLHEADLVVPAISYEIVKIDSIKPGLISLRGGNTLLTPLLSHRLAGASYISFGVTTIGTGIAKTVSRWFAEGRHVKAYVLEEIANALLFKVSEKLQELIETQAALLGLSTGGPVSPGDHDGFEIDQQKTVLALAGAGAIGIKMTSTNQMDPVHSVSFVSGIGRKMKKWSRADNCSICRAREKCIHRLNYQELTT